MVSPYVVLQVDPDADEEAVEEAYRRRVKETHPDHGGSATEFRLVKLAYEEIQSGADPSTYGAAPGREGLRREDRVRGPAERDGQRGTVRDRVGQGADGRWRAGGDGRDSQSRRRTGIAHVEYLDYEVMTDHGWELDDDDLFEKAGAADLSDDEHGRLAVDPGQSLLEAAEESGYSWPFSCRGGACANCAVAVIEGDLAMPVNTILTDELKERGIRLSCNGEPVVDDMKVVFNVKHLPELDDLRLPARSFAVGED